MSVARAALVLALLSKVAEADVLESVSMNRGVEATCDLSVGDDPSMFEEFEAEGPGNDPWVTGVVADLFAGTGEAIGVADQSSSFADDGTTAFIRAEGFASGSARSGADDEEDVDDVEADGRSTFRVTFRVTAETEFTLSGSIWATGWSETFPWVYENARVLLETQGFPEDVAIDLVDGNKIDFSYSGTLVPGRGYSIDIDVDALASANYDDGVTYSAYAAGGFDVDLALSSDALPVRSVSVGELKRRFR